MLEVGTGLFRGTGKWAGNSRWIKKIRPDLVFRDIPRKWVQWRRQAQRLRRLGLRRTPVYAPDNGIVPVAATPTRLRFPPARGLTLRLATGPLPVSYSRLWPEPPATDSAWSLSGLGHRDDSSSPRHRPAGQIRMRGSFLESTGGSILASAEGKRSRRFSSRVSVSSWTSAAAVVKRTRIPRWQAARPRASPVCVFPLPELPRHSTFSRRSIHSHRASSSARVFCSSSAS